ncbi:MAG TPA: nitrate reductase cytochrome c-type subunit [Rhodopila sp.]
MRIHAPLLLSLLLPTCLNAQDLPDVPRLSGNTPPTDPVKAPAVPAAIADDVRLMRSYPEQPPTIPHAIEGYQLTLSTNRCLSCHARQFVQATGAPMISVTHFMDREGQVLADVTPRRYFCTACHVTQSDAPLLVPNVFRDAVPAGAH